jgi:RHS repeat-associated protein
MREFFKKQINVLFEKSHLVSVSGSVSASFIYDGDGSRVKSTLDGTTTTFVGTHYEVTGSSVTKYYYLGASRVALRNSSGVRYLFGDHLGSTSVTSDISGGNVIRQLYKAWGEVRYSSSSLPTKYTYTGQYAYNGSGEIGLMYYVARFYDPALSHFITADYIIPEANQGVQAWNRYTYVNNSPVNFIDPTGNNCEDLPQGSREACIAAREKPEQSEPAPGISQEQHERLISLHQKANELSTLMQSGKITDLEALALILEFAAPFYTIGAPEYGLFNEDSFLNDLGIVIGGIEIRGNIFTHVYNFLQGRFEPSDAFRVIDNSNPLARYYVSYSAFDPDIGTNGFSNDLNPFDDNQVRHFLAGAASGNAFLGLGRNYLLEQELSTEDIALYILSFEFADILNLGFPLYLTGDWVRITLGK